MNRTKPCIAITSGEPAGIGPDLCLMNVQHAKNEHGIDANIVIIGDAAMLSSRAKLLNLDADLPAYVPNQNKPFSVLHIPCQQTAIAGKLNQKNAHYVLNTLSRAVDGCLTGEFDAVATAPVHKGVINDANINFTGHTEFLADYTNTAQVVMMLVGGGLRVALATTHLPLAEVSAAINVTTLENTLRILCADLKIKFGINNPKILVAGLNPHAGEDGYLGSEEIDIINPVLEKLRREGMRLVGALPADTLFTKRHLEQADCALAMYHDQGLPVLKYASFGAGVNITLGLPIIRTSVDHGTALDLAGSGQIEIGSMQAAINLAIDLAARQSTTTI